MPYQVKNLCKQYGGNVVLEDVSLALEAGKIHGLIGYNGVGKSTLSKIMGGVLQREGGELVLDGQRIDSWDVRRAALSGVFLVDSHSTMLPKQTIFENMLYGLNSLNRKGVLPVVSRRGWIRQRLKHEIQKYELNCEESMQVSQISYSLKCVLELLRIKIFSPRYLIVDETDANVNDYYKNIIGRIFKDLCEAGTGILYITHNIEHLVELSDQISILQEARIVDTISRDMVHKAGVMELFYNMASEHPPRTIIKPQEKILEFSHISNGKLKDFSMYVHEGEIVGILGLEKEGAASMEAIFFHDGYTRRNRIHEGKTFLHEKEIRIRTPQDAIEAGLLLLDANEIDKFLFPGRTVYENMIPYTFMIKCHDQDRQREICAKYLRRLSIAAKPDDKIEHISTGYQKKVLIARNILAEGEVYVFNNPTDNVDVVSKVDIYNIINELKRRGNGIILASNDYQEITGISDIIIIVRGGRIIKKYKNISQDRREVLPEQYI